MTQQPLTLAQASLIKRMAWRNIHNIEHPKPPTDADAWIVPIAVRMLSYISCLDYAMIDLQDDLIAGGLFRHEIKRQFNRAFEIVNKVHTEAFKMLQRLNNGVERQYNDVSESGYRAIQDGITITGLERSYSIVLALCRRIEQSNRQIRGKYDFKPAEAIYTVPGMLDVIKAEDMRLDRIIELNTKNTIQ